MARPALFLIFVLFYVFFVLFYVFLCSMYCLFCDVPCIVCVYTCTEQLPPGGYPIAVKYIISIYINIYIYIYIYIYLKDSFPWNSLVSGGTIENREAAGRSESAVSFRDKF